MGYLRRVDHAFWMLLAVFIVSVLIEQYLFPVVEGNDESLHLIYAIYLQDENRLPDRATAKTNDTRQESGQPPLTYALGALWLKLLGVPAQDPDQVAAYLDSHHNLWLSPPNPWSPDDNLNYFLHGNGEIAFGSPPIVNADRLLRLIALAFGVIAVIGAYNAAREMFSKRSWVLTATVLFAFMPTMLHMASYYNNDITATAFSTLAIWQGLIMLRRGASRERLLLIGLMLALAVLSKVSALLIAPGIGLALVFDWRRRVGSLLRWILDGLVLGLPLIALFLPWVVYGIVNYHDPLGLQTHIDPHFQHNPLLLPWQTIIYMPEIYLSYWAKFGLAKVYLHPLIYTVLGLIPVVSIIGYVVYRPKFDRNSAR